MFVNQSIQHPRGVNVFGSCLIRVEPDYASLRFAVNRLAERPARAFEEARLGVRAVRSFLSGEGLHERHLRTSQILLEQAYDGYGAERRFIGYRTKVSFQATLERLERLEPVLIGLVEAGVDQIEQVSFKARRLRELRD